MGKIIDWDTHKVGKSFLARQVALVGQTKNPFYIMIDSDPTLYTKVVERLIGAGVEWGDLGSWDSFTSCLYLRIYSANKKVWAVRGHSTGHIQTGRSVYTADHIVVPKTIEEKENGDNTTGLVAEGGLKFDGEKPRYDLLPWGATDEVVKVLTVGASKYAPNNWQLVRGGRWRYFGAAGRHLAAYARGEERDPETGLHHLAHACCCCLFIISLDRGIDKTTLHDGDD